MLRIAAFLSLWLALATPVLAAEPKPAIMLKTKAAEISVSIDDAIKHKAGPAANLLDEGKSWIDKQSKDASAEPKSSPELFRGGQRWTLERSYAEGAHTAFVPWKAFAAYLSPKGKTIFAGEKPPEAADKDK